MKILLAPNVRMTEEEIEEAKTQAEENIEFHLQKCREEEAAIDKVLNSSTFQRHIQSREQKQYLNGIQEGIKQAKLEMTNRLLDVVVGTNREPVDPDFYED